MEEHETRFRKVGELLDTSVSGFIDPDKYPKIRERLVLYRGSGVYSFDGSKYIAGQIPTYSRIRLL